LAMSRSRATTSRRSLITTWQLFGRVLLRERLETRQGY
jgi:hypothetical protein